MSPLQPAAVRRVAVVGGSRIPFARSDGPYATASNQEMLTAALDGLVERYGLQGRGAVGEFVAGAVLKHSRDFNLARETVLGSALDPRTPAYDIQQACGTGLQAVIAAANKIALGQTESAIAGGADTASDAPLGVNDTLRKVLLEARRAKTLGARLKALAKVRPGHLVLRGFGELALVVRSSYRRQQAFQTWKTAFVQQQWKASLAAQCAAVP